jgi:hypothetical protein
VRSQGRPVHFTSLALYNAPDVQPLSRSLE